MTKTPDAPDMDEILRAAGAAGVDLDALDASREAALGTLPVLAAARDVIDRRSTSGAAGRVQTLRDALEHLMAVDPVSAVVVTAALWLDRYGSSGAPERLANLQDAVDVLHGGTLGMTLENAVESGAYTGRPDHLSDLFTDAPPCDVDPVAHEERLAYLEPDDGQD
jgi:hypothetical protein